MISSLAVMTAMKIEISILERELSLLQENWTCEISFGFVDLYL